MRRLRYLEGLRDEDRRGSFDAERQCGTRYCREQRQLRGDGYQRLASSGPVLASAPRQ
jgi:hypothetical protein